MSFEAEMRIDVVLFGVSTKGMEVFPPENPGKREPWRSSRALESFYSADRPDDGSSKNWQFSARRVHSWFEVQYVRYGMAAAGTRRLGSFLGVAVFSFQTCPDDLLEVQTELADFVESLTRDGRLLEERAGRLEYVVESLHAERAYVEQKLEQLKGRLRSLFDGVYILDVPDAESLEQYPTVGQGTPKAVAKEIFLRCGALAVTGYAADADEIREALGIPDWALPKLARLNAEQPSLEGNLFEKNSGDLSLDRAIEELRSEINNFRGLSLRKLSNIERVAASTTERLEGRVRELEQAHRESLANLALELPSPDKSLQGNKTARLSRQAVSATRSSGYGSGRRDSESLTWMLVLFPILIVVVLISLLVWPEDEIARSEPDPTISEGSDSRQTPANLPESKFLEVNIFLAEMERKGKRVKNEEDFLEDVGYYVWGKDDDIKRRFASATDYISFVENKNGEQLRRVKQLIQSRLNESAGVVPYKSDSSWINSINGEKGFVVR